MLALMTNGSKSSATGAAAAAINETLNGGSADLPLELDDCDDMIKEEEGGRDSEVDRVAKSIGYMKVYDDKQIFASDAHCKSTKAMLVTRH